MGNFEKIKKELEEIDKNYGEKLKNKENKKRKRYIKGNVWSRSISYDHASIFHGSTNIAL